VNPLHSYYLKLHRLDTPKKKPPPLEVTPELVEVKAEPKHQAVQNVDEGVDEGNTVV